MIAFVSYCLVCVLCTAFGYTIAGGRQRPFYGRRTATPQKITIRGEHPRHEPPNGSTLYVITGLGEEALADAYASEHGMRDSPESRPMCGCGNCDGDLGPHVLAMHGELMRILDAKDGKDA